VIDALDAMKKPTVLVIQQKWPDHLMKKAGLAGEMMVSQAMAVGCVGLLSNGPSRDVDAIRRLKFQYMLGGVTAGHGEQAVHAVNVPVSVGGMDVAPGDLIHMDENGAVKFPVQHAEAVVKNSQAMLADEGRAPGEDPQAHTRPRSTPPWPAAPTRPRRSRSLLPDRGPPGPLMIMILSGPGAFGSAQARARGPAKLSSSQHEQEGERGGQDRDQRHQVEGVDVADHAGLALDLDASRAWTWPSPIGPKACTQGAIRSRANSVIELARLTCASAAEWANTSRVTDTNTLEPSMRISANTALACVM
jgi:hypothetical protein